MRRREFIGLLGGAAAAMPLAVRAQERVRRIGVLMSSAEDDPEGQARAKLLQETLQTLDWGRAATFGSTTGGLVETKDGPQYMPPN
jgi:hypothetical protein